MFLFTHLQILSAFSSSKVTLRVFYCWLYAVTFPVQRFPYRLSLFYTFATHCGLNCVPSRSSAVIASMSKRSGGGGRSVQVSGYTRSNGIYVQGYTRSAPSSSGSRASSASSSQSSFGGVYVSGYTRSDGTHVGSYTRSAPSANVSRASSAQSSQSVSGVVQVSGYTRSDGTNVEGYTRSLPSSSASSTVSNSGTVHVSGYTRSDGTYVQPYTRSSPASGSATSREALDLVQVKEYTRSDGVIVKEHTRQKPQTPQKDSSASSKSIGDATGSSATSQPSKERTYVDNPMNRRLGRVGKVIPKRNIVRRDIRDNNTIQDVIDILKNMAIDNERRCDYQSALYDLQRSELENQFKSSGKEPVTEHEKLREFTASSGMKLAIIPFKELELQGEAIGKGSYGEVYAATFKGTVVAFKQLLYQHMSTKRRDKFVNEISILSSLDHSNTVKLFGAVVDQDHLGIVMEYLPRSLFHAIFIDPTEFEEATKKKQVLQVADALVYLHTNQIVHCDVKSENVLLDKNDNAKLGDFGLSAVKSATQSSQSGLPDHRGQGTPRYSAPEVLRGELLNFEKLRLTDVYSLGIVAFEVLAEEEPFEGLSVKQLEKNVGQGTVRPSIPSCVSQAVQHLLQSCWSAVANDRPSSEEFRNVWESSDLYCTSSETHGCLEFCVSK